ncbi:MAG: TerB family tellurite resistance protein [Amylibacter sp.]|jgi:uncharacterized tellurite resistance protein B-like protein|nr:TerB family tellurite resistance protein [Amylibacter sp.]|tara:strand:+ start:627 stop:1061 length:435 start_codon:yes stop_codon:yes gene_type:complete
MLKDILNAFKSTAPPTLRMEDASLAMAALLVRLARSDEDYDASEKILINKMLQFRYNLALDKAEALRIEAEELESKAPDTVRFTRLIKDSVPYEDRQSVIRDFWEIVLADGERHKEESSLMRLIAKLLGVNDRDSAIARQSVGK